VVSYLRRDSAADAGVFWHAGSVLALPEAGLPSQYSRLLEPEEFAGGLTVPVASHTHRVASDGARILFAVDDGTGRVDEPGNSDPEGVFLRVGEWDALGALRRAQSIALERATWQHDIGVTAKHVVFVESPTGRLTSTGGVGDEPSPSEGEPDPDLRRVPRVPFGWTPGAEGWVGVVPRDGDGTAVQWHRLDPSLVTHVLGAWEEGDPRSDGTIVLFVCRYQAPEKGQPVDTSASVVGPGIGLTAIGGSMPVLERWRLTADRLERTQVDERHVEYPRIDRWCEGDVFRYGYAIELDWAQPHLPTGDGDTLVAGELTSTGLLKFDLTKDEASSWRPGAFRTPSEPLFVRAADGRNDEEGWLLCLVDDHNRGGTDLVVLDASSMGRRGPEAIIHLPVRLPLRAHGEWVPAEWYR
jgi:carotenoid cleavage dioxygenase